MNSMWNFPEKRILDDPSNETVIFEAGYKHHDSTRGYFCKVSMNGVCVEAFGFSKRDALKQARKAWRKEKEKRNQENYGYPRVCESMSRYKPGGVETPDGVFWTVPTPPTDGRPAL